MKKFLFYTLTAGLLLSACSQTISVEEPLPGPENPSQKDEPQNKYLISATRINVISANAIADKMEQLSEEYGLPDNSNFIGSFPGPQWQIETYRIIFRTADSHGKEAAVSGNVSLLRNGSGSRKQYLNTVSLCHPMVVMNDESALDNTDLREVRTLYNSLVIVPFCQGVMEDRGRHVPPVSESLLRARQSIDCELAALELVNEMDGVSMSEDYYTENIGDSNGGSAALAFLYLVEQKLPSDITDKIRLRATYCSECCNDFAPLLIDGAMSGKGMENTSLSTRHLMQYVTVIFICSAYDAWKDVHFKGIDLESYFSEAFLNASLDGKPFSIIESFNSGNIPFDGTMLTSGSPTIFEQTIEGYSKITDLLNGDLYDDTGKLKTDDPRITALRDALDENAIRKISGAFLPNSNVRIVHSTADDMIPFDGAWEDYLWLSDGGKDDKVEFRPVFFLNHFLGSYYTFITDILLKRHPCPVE